MKLRKEVQQFAEVMERKLRKHDAERGATWKDDSISQLMERLHEEVGELEGAVNGSHGFDCIASEAADVANFAMFIQWIAATWNKAERVTNS